MWIIVTEWVIGSPLAPFHWSHTHTHQVQNLLSTAVYHQLSDLVGCVIIGVGEFPSHPPPLSSLLSPPPSSQGYDNSVHSIW